MAGLDAIQQLVQRTVELADGRVKVTIDQRADGDDDGDHVFEQRNWWSPLIGPARTVSAEAVSAHLGQTSSRC